MQSKEKAHIQSHGSRKQPCLKVQKIKKSKFLSFLQVYLGGGDGPCGARSEIYSFQTNSWRQCGKKLKDRKHMGAALFVNPEGKPMVIGIGGNSLGAQFSDVEFFDIETEEWTTGPAFPYVIPGFC